MDWTRVDGQNHGSVRLYALSTCGWCRETKALLDELQVAYEYKYVDMLAGSERDEAISDVARWNPGRSFPTVVIDDARAVVGYKPDKIREILGNAE